MRRELNDSLGQAERLEGKPERGFWMGLKTNGRGRFPVRTDRCTGCGYLEFHANKEPAAWIDTSTLGGIACSS